MDLRKTDCSHQNLDELPNIPNDTEFLDLHNNEIYGLISHYALPTSLRRIDLSYNRLTWIVREVFDELVNLIWLNMNHNNLSYTDDIFEPGLFKPLAHLQHLYMKHNCMDCELLPNISFFPSAISDLVSLTDLAIDTYMHATFPESYKNLTNLKNIDMSCDIYGTKSRMKCKAGTAFCRKRIGPNFFRYIPNLNSVNISGCDIRSVATGAFSMLHNLKHLNVSNNQRLSFRAMWNITFGLNNTSIDILDVSGLHCEFGVTTVLYKEDIENLKNTNLTTLKIDDNRLIMPRPDALLYLPKTIRTISARYNQLQPGTYLIAFSKLPNIAYLDVSRRHHPFPTTEASNLFENCHDSRCERTERTDEHLEMSALQMNQLLERRSRGRFILPIPRNLQVLKLSNYLMDTPLLNVAFSENIVQQLEFKNDMFINWQGPFGPFPHLKILDMSSNYCNNVSTQFFDLMTNISSLNVNDNLLGFWFAFDESRDTFNKLEKLDYLDISKNRIRYMPYRIFSKQVSLQTLNLSNNIISVFNISISHMINLQELDVTNNFITSLSGDMRKQIDEIKEHNSGLIIRLQGNPLRCTCEELDALTWYMSNQQIFMYFDQYTCIYENKTLIPFSNLHQVVTQLEKECPSYLGLIFSVISLLTLSIAIVLSGIIFQYRWKIRYMYYILKSKQDKPNQHQTEQVYDYDAFVSYSDQQRNFVINNMLLKLENEHGLRLCVHQRDFTPGKDIATNITSAIHRSRKTLIVLSKSFLESNWCVFEFNMARMEEIYAREGRHSVLYVVFYENIPMKKIPLQLLELIERQSYIEYPKDEQGDIVFWDKLATSLVN